MTNPAAAAIDEDYPEAPSPRPPLVLFLRVTENDVLKDWDGGSLVFTRVAGQNAEVIENVRGANLVLSATTDAFLRTFPWKSRAAMQRRVFRVTCEEVSIDDVPPDPNAPPKLFNEAGARVDAHGNLLR